MSDSISRSTVVAVMSYIVFAMAVPVAATDEVQLANVTVRGTITAVEPGGLVIEPEFGTGAVTLAYETITAITTDRSFLVLHGETDEVVGRLLGIDDGKLLVGANRETAVAIEPGTIFSGNATNGSLTRWDRLKSRWRYWNAAFDAGLSHFDGTTDSTQATLGFEAERRKAGTRLLARTGYRFGTEGKSGEPTSTLTNELRGLLKGEYDLSERFLVLSSFDGEYDEIEQLSFRGIPKLGLGYRIYKTPTAFLQIESAPAYIYERFFGGRTNDFFGLSFGAETGAKLPYDMLLAGRVDYLPSVKEWTEDYLIRSEISLTMPLVSVLNLRFAVANQYDNTPADGVDRNEVLTTLGISIRL